MHMNTWVPVSRGCDIRVGLKISDCRFVIWVTLNELFKPLCASVVLSVKRACQCRLARTIRNTVLGSKFDLVDCSKEGNSPLQRARRPLRKKVLGGVVAGFEFWLGDLGENSKKCGFCCCLWLGGRESRRPWLEAKLERTRAIPRLR